MTIALAGADQKSGRSIDLVGYFSIVILSAPIIRSRVHEKLSELISTGEINSLLIKPVKIYNYLFVTELSQKLFSSFLAGTIVIIPFLTSQPGIQFLIPITKTIFGLLLAFNISYLVGLLSFWIDESWAMQNLHDVALVFFGGAILPFSLFPDWLAELIKLTPYYYTLSWNTKLSDGSLVAEMFIALFWLVILGITRVLLEKKAILKHGFTAS